MQGIDILKVERMLSASKRLKERFFNEGEDVVSSFAAKEAFIKAAGGHFASFVWKDLKLVKLRTGEPWFVARGTARRLLGVRRPRVTVTDEKECVVVAVELV